MTGERLSPEMNATPWEIVRTLAGFAIVAVLPAYAHASDTLAASSTMPDDVFVVVARAVEATPLLSLGYADVALVFALFGGRGRTSVVE